MTISEEFVYEAVVVLQPLWVHSSTPIYNVPSSDMAKYSDKQKI
jgi:hypothetical protein